MATRNLWVRVSLLLALLAMFQSSVFGESQVPCFFILGDSLVDNGNNNNLETTAKANFPPYGIDFPEGPTGRFSNGRNIADIIAQFLGFDEYIPPFATARDQDILMGVNYGSGGAGIRDESGTELGAVISLNQQLLNHQIIVSRIGVLLGSKEEAANYLSKCIYYVGMGSNDYINNYLLPQYFNTSHLYTPEQYAIVLIQQYSQQLKTLYKYGARKVALFGLGEIGCTPAEMASYGTNGSEVIDKDVQLFNEGLSLLVDELNNNLTDSEFIFINITEISSGDASAYGITIANASCCVVSSNIGKGLCAPNLAPCSNRTLYAYWDGFHPTEVANLFLATGAYNALTPLISALEHDSDEGSYII
ncbi:GDSL esterase/lipase At4g18970-like [Rhododendron vialii]|uniref:GDSL esterase/lipase At4g18970-like n=1 Tax=Rhododendron vialii TaxID=182163 RepID=UPI00265DA322|nr:GDSL esterase/lipase At4g18970-like [Rhododendron vialii]